MFIKRILSFLFAVAISLPLFALVPVPHAQAAASFSFGGPGTATVGDTVTYTLNINTGGQMANAFQGTISYPADLLEGVRGSYSGSICTLPITVPEPSGGTASFSCGRPAGYTGTGLLATVVFKVIAAGSGTIRTSGTEVLAADGQGTSIPTSNGSLSFSYNGANAPSATPTKSAGGTATPKSSKSPTPTSSKSSTPSGPTVAPETAKPAEETPTPTPPPVLSLASPTPFDSGSDEPVDEGSGQRRTIGQAIQDLLKSSKDIGKIGSNATGVIALLLTIIPFLAITLAILFLGYRLYMMERRRRRTLDRLFEMELAELAALEGKLDILAEKGNKGREQYREEFQKTKENILRQLKPEYGKSVAGGKKADPPATEGTK